MYDDVYGYVHGHLCGYLHGFGPVLLKCRIVVAVVLVKVLDMELVPSAALVVALVVVLELA